MRMSKAYDWICNLYNAAVQHKEDCNRPDCNVSLMTLKTIAQSIHSVYLQDFYPEELVSIRQKLENWPF